MSKILILVAVLALTSCSTSMPTVKEVKTDFQFTCTRPSSWPQKPDFYFINNYVANTWNCFEDLEAAKKGLEVLALD